MRLKDNKTEKRVEFKKKDLWSVYYGTYNVYESYR